jgi:dTDP-4-dehydrorhamnose reductase
VSPSYVVDVVAATKRIVECGEPGLYHCVGTGHATWYELAKEIARLMRKDHEARLVPISVAEVSLQAPRPTFSALANDKLTKIADMPTWQDALRRYLEFRERSRSGGILGV